MVSVKTQGAGRRYGTRSDARYVKLLMDVAHCKQGGGDSVKAIKQYRDRMVFSAHKRCREPDSR